MPQDKRIDNLKKENETDLVQITNIIWRKKLFIILGTVLITSIAIIITFSLPEIYEISGFFQLSSGDVFGRTSLPDYKKYSSKFLDLNHYQKYLELNKNIGEDMKTILSEWVAEIKNLEKFISPKYAFSEREDVQIESVLEKKEEYVLGLEIKAYSHSSREASNIVRHLGSFVRDCILYIKLCDYILINFNKTQLNLKNTDNKIIKTQFKLEQLAIKLQDVKRLLKKYPQSGNISTREFISLEGGGQRYLSPTMQALGIESLTIDIKENLASFERLKKVFELRIKFFSKARDLLLSEIFAENLFNKLLNVRAEIFKNQDLSGGILREVYNDLNSDFENFLSYRKELAFISGPTFSESYFQLKRILFVAFIFIISFFIFVYLSFLLKWLAYHKKEILAK